MKGTCVWILGLLLAVAVSGGATARTALAAVVEAGAGNPGSGAVGTGTETASQENGAASAEAGEASQENGAAGTGAEAASPGNGSASPGAEVTSTEAGAANSGNGIRTGWRQEGGGWCYYQEDGSRLTSALTPDGYLVDGEGIWKRQQLDILGQKVTTPERFVNASRMGNWSGVLPALDNINRSIQRSLNGKRIFHVYEDGIRYCRVESGSRETELVSLVRDRGSDGYQICLRTDLGKRNSDWTSASTYDHEVFLYFCALVSNRPVVLADAIYRNWQGDNGYGLSRETRVQVEDALVRYQAEDGCGIYYVENAWKGQE